MPKNKPNFKSEFSVLIQENYALVTIGLRKYLVRPQSLYSISNKSKELMEAVGNIVRAHDLIKETTEYTDRIVCNWLKNKAENRDLSKMPKILKHLHSELDKDIYLKEVIEKRIEEIDKQLNKYTGDKFKTMREDLQRERIELLGQRKEIVDNA
jgi:molecular chaperone DnaK (HSP70)